MTSHAKQVLTAYCDELLERIRTTEFTDPKMNKYWAVVKNTALENAEKLKAAAAHLSILTTEDQEIFEQALWRVQHLLGSAHDDFSTINWLVRASSRFHDRLQSTTLIPPATD